MGKIELINISKQYGKKTALKNINLEIRDKEFFVIFGPAGAGKTTLLRIIAGVEYTDTGLLKLNDKISNYEEPYKRDIAMVFENYALYPNLKVYDNIAFPLRSSTHKTDEATIKEMVHKIAKTLKIEKQLDKLPQHISNGQKQRTALGRALVRNPLVFLMDEPLAHLDAKLKSFMRTELKELQTKLDTTTVYVTHDYCEALSLGNRIAILNEGEIVQIGTGQEIYSMPVNKFVAKLVGEPEINIVRAQITYCDKQIKFRVFDKYDIHNDDSETISKLKSKDYKNIDIGLRSVDISIFKNRGNEEEIEATIYSIEPIGNKVLFTVKIGNEKLRFASFYDSSFKMNEKVFIQLNMAHALYFDTENDSLVIGHNLNRN